MFDSQTLDWNSKLNRACSMTSKKRKSLNIGVGTGGPWLWKIEVLEMKDCVFCSIVKGVAPASVIYSDDEVMAFMDTTPVNSGHVLVIPKAHAAQLSELNPDTGAQIFKVVMRVAEALKKSGLRCEGVNLFLADGEAAFQDIFHVHLHVIPRFKGDGFGLKLRPDYGIKPKRKELNETADKIKKTMQQEQ